MAQREEGHEAHNDTWMDDDDGDDEDDDDDDDDEDNDDDDTISLLEPEVVTPKET